MSTHTPHEDRDLARKTAEALSYLHGFGNLHSSEAMAGALPDGNHAPQRPPLGLYTEQISGSAFTEPRGGNRHSWMYRIRPSAQHGAFRRIGGGGFHGLADAEIEMNRSMWSPLPDPAPGTDFVSGMWPLGGNGDPAERTGMAVYLYAANTSMKDKVFSDSDGELLITPQAGELLVHTEFGPLHVKVGDVALIPRGVRFQVELLDVSARGYVAENFGRPLVLPELGPLGANGMANPEDFRAPTAAYDEVERPVEVIVKYCGELWGSVYDHSPLDVVAWHGNHVPYVYDLNRFQTVGTLTYDHTDPSVFTILTSPTDTPGVPNMDFLAPNWRWSVAEDTFRPQYYHRNISTEIYGVIKAPPGRTGVYGAPGSISVQNMMTPHGVVPEADSAATQAELRPERIDGHLMCAYETRLPLKFTRQALDSERRHPDYDSLWQGFERRFGR
ncbi:homogentisate 1,2-dioxygenase [Streptosporangium sp. 'caverna']|uniref:homogentisate 1,2-dioxygenase n=1 Tax=Streptosporangium sp. 'caverna' TaxID=2202249 RepID=UPI000D7E2A99|nr:homogentisate 1,2-dioxygenase [Streptosporangium sp. 'caverna']AWS43848.1 homogentisate 1,2-dioxygenase [Streptosporangium sp. 'caverna']